MATRVLSLPARAGIEWLRGGMVLLGQQFLSVLLIVMGYFFFIFFGTLLSQWAATAAQSAGADAELIGRLISIVIVMFVPAMTLGVLEGCRAVSQGQLARPILLFSAFRLPRKQFLSLLGLGLFQAVVLMCVGLAVLAAHPELATKGVAPSADGPPDTAMLEIMGAGAFVQLMLWYAGMLCAWHAMGAPKALFFSLGAVWRNLGAFVVFFATWFLVMVAAATLLVLVYALSGDSMVTFAVGGPFMTVLMAAFHCSWFMSYRSVFVDDDKDSGRL